MTDLSASAKRAIVAKAMAKYEDIAICAKCADDAGGNWPDTTHIGTFNVVACGVCGTETACCSVSDFAWPGLRKTLQREI